MFRSCLPQILNIPSTASIEGHYGFEAATTNGSDTEEEEDTEAEETGDTPTGDSNGGQGPFEGVQP